MRRSALLLGFLLVLAACGGTSGDDSSTTTVAPTTTLEPGDTTTTEATTTTMAEADFPVSVEVGGQEVTVEERPTRIVSLSPTATETVFAIGAGDQVVAVDEFSNYPADVPTTNLSGFTPNIEAIAEFDPDMILIQFDPDGIITSAFEPLGVHVINQPPAVDRADLLAQIEQLGALTGHVAEAVQVTSAIAERWDAATEADAAGAKVYIEVDPTFYSASSGSFMGSALVDLGFENIADAADPDGFGFPQLSAESILSANPDVIIVGTDLGTTAEDIAARPGWDTMNAAINDRILQIDSDISSRWGPRFIEYVETMADLARSLVTTG